MFTICYSSEIVYRNDNEKVEDFMSRSWNLLLKNKDVKKLLKLAPSVWWDEDYQDVWYEEYDKNDSRYVHGSDEELINIKSIEYFIEMEDDNDE